MLETDVQSSVYLEALYDIRGRFAPEFEYDEWAMAWRTRLQVAFLEFAHKAIKELIRRGLYADARDAALRALEADPDARDAELLLIGLYWRLGAESAAKAQYAHFATREREDGLEPPSLKEIAEHLAGG